MTTNPFAQVPPDNEQIHVMFDNGVWKLVLDGLVVYTFMSETHYRNFSIQVHAMEKPLARS